MKNIAYLACLLLLTFCGNAATFSGTVENKFGDFIGFTKLTATKSNSSDQIEFTAGRNGTFSVELTDGTWTIDADVIQIAAWGYAPVENYELVIAGENILSDVVLYASEPLLEPEMEIYRSQSGALNLSLNGQGGTRFIVKRSYDLASWHSYYETTTAKGALSTSANAPSDRNTVFYRLTVSLE
jgi:hypothetical protein